MKIYKYYIIGERHLRSHGYGEKHGEKTFKSMEKLRDFLKIYPYRIDSVKIKEEYFFKNKSENNNLDLNNGEYNHDYIDEALEEMK